MKIFTRIAAWFRSFDDPSYGSSEALAELEAGEPDESCYNMQSPDYNAMEITQHAESARVLSLEAALAAGAAREARQAATIKDAIATIERQAKSLDVVFDTLERIRSALRAVPLGTLDGHDPLDHVARLIIGFRTYERQHDADRQTIAALESAKNAARELAKRTRNRTERATRAAVKKRSR